MTAAVMTDNPELDAYKERVATVARLYAEQHGWCTVVNEALAEIEAEVPSAVEDMITDAVEGAYDRGRDDGEERAREDEHEYAVQQAAEKYEPLVSLVDEAMRYHDDHHKHVARFCSHVMCRTAWDAQQALR